MGVETPPKLERRERDTRGQDLEYTCHGLPVIQAPGGRKIWSLKGSAVIHVLRRVQLPRVLACSRSRRSKSAVMPPFLWSQRRVLDASS
jgi:hypothetical protein